MTSPRKPRPWIRADDMMRLTRQHLWKRLEALDLLTVGAVIREFDRARRDALGDLLPEVAEGERLGVLRGTVIEQLRALRGRIDG